MPVLSPSTLPLHSGSRVTWCIQRAQLPRWGGPQLSKPPGTFALTPALHHQAKCQAQHPQGKQARRHESKNKTRIGRVIFIMVQTRSRDLTAKGAPQAAGRFLSPSASSLLPCPEPPPSGNRESGSGQSETFLILPSPQEKPISRQIFGMGNCYLN